MLVFVMQILVHGEQNEMARLKAALIREYEDNDEVHIEVHNPRNTEAVTLNFRGEKLAKVNANLFFALTRIFSWILVKGHYFSYLIYI